MLLSCRELPIQFKNIRVPCKWLIAKFAELSDLFWHQ